MNRDLLRLKARFLLAMGPALAMGPGLIACHSAGPDASANPPPTATASIPAPTASAGTAPTDTTGATVATGATTTPSNDAGTAVMIQKPPPGMHAVTLPDGGVGFARMPFLGRPLRVEDEPRVAPSATRADWITPLELTIAALSPEERALHAEMWKRDAASEHASIASFSRFSLQLLALGAPADLIEAAHDAALDEARHARDAYALASAYAGEAVGPGRLDVRGALEHIADVTLAKLAVETFTDGCIGETVAAWDAREKTAACNDATLREIFTRVADDEERHAALAWQAVAWAVRTGGDEVRHALKAAVDHASASAAMAQNTLFSSVIAPCAEAILET